MTQRGIAARGTPARIARVSSELSTAAGDKAVDNCFESIALSKLDVHLRHHCPMKWQRLRFTARIEGSKHSRARSRNGNPGQSGTSRRQRAADSWRCLSRARSTRGLAAPCRMVLSAGSTSASTTALPTPERRSTCSAIQSASSQRSHQNPDVPDLSKGVATARLTTAGRDSLDASGDVKGSE